MSRVKNSSVIDVSDLRTLGQTLTDALGVVVTFEPTVGSRVRPDSLQQRFAPEGECHSSTMGTREEPGVSQSSRTPCDQIVASTPSDDSRTEVSMRAAGQVLGTWYIQGPPENLKPGPTPRGVATLDSYTRQTDSVGACAILDCPAKIGRESAVGLVTQIASLITDAYYERERLADAVAYHSERALRKTAALCVLERITDSLPIGLIEVDRSGEIGWANQQARKLLGMNADPSEEYLDSWRVSAVVSINDMAPSEAYTPLVRQLARGKVVRGVRCVLMRADGTSFAASVDASPDRSENQRIDRVVLVLRLPYDDGSNSDAVRPSWEEVGALVNIVNTRAVSKRAEIAGRIQRGVTESLQSAWLEFDALRQDLDKSGDPAVSGRLETIGLLLREATANAVDVGMTCRPQVWDHRGVVAALESRLSDVETITGINWCLTDRSNGEYSLDATRCTVFFHVGDELISRAADESCKLEVTLDANEHYWLLVVSSYGNEYSDSRTLDCFVDARVRETLQSLSGTIETVRLSERHLVHYVMLPTCAQ